MKRSIQRTIAGLALTLITVAMLTSGASAATTPPPDWFERAVERQTAQTTNGSDAHQRASAAASLSAGAAPDWFERAANRSIAQGAGAPLDAHQRTIASLSPVIASAAPATQATQSASTVPDGGFAWRDAGFGAVAALALALIAGAAAMGIHQRRQVALS